MIFVQSELAHKETEIKYRLDMCSKRIVMIYAANDLLLCTFMDYDYMNACVSFSTNCNQTIYKINSLYLSDLSLNISQDCA